MGRYDIWYLSDAFTKNYMLWYVKHVQIHILMSYIYKIVISFELAFSNCKYSQTFKEEDTVIVGVGNVTLYFLQH